ncbi:hypothetical protein EKO27_g8155 [Xylaria grammica]|uniref:arabinan endo-1,5-alpha-L-arabinosidase n=1 Tax=Xylaria grammica TaxID=363999 RepID=A0A439CXN4_9PEZI|nr:hypothetical protein EKO27_g8155 [Xylaria grammica]
MVTLRTSALGFLPLLGSVLGYANPNACSGTCTNAHDPAIIRRADGTYFRFSTNGKIAVHTAPDITGPWTYKGAALPSGSSIDLPGNQDLWAPDVTLVGDTYYLYYAVSQFGSQDSAIGVATSTTLDVGSWTDRGSTGVKSSSAKPYNAIDANLINVDGTYYLTWGSFWGDIYQAPMKASPLTLASGASSYQVAYDPVTTAQGPVLRLRRGAAGRRGRVQDPGVPLVVRDGRFVDKSGAACTSGGGTVVLESHDNVYGPGGQGVYQDPNHGPILYYHYVDKTIGYADGDKRFGWNTIDFSSGWPVV